MSNPDAMQDNEQPTQEQPLDNANIQEGLAENNEALAASDNDADSEDEGYEVVERNQEPSPELEQKKRNSAMAKRRIEAKEAKKRAELAEAQLEEIKRGVIPDNLKDKLNVAPSLPDQPSISDYLSDEALAKYDYDSVKAQAAFNQANSQWLFDAQNARSTSQVNEAKARTDYVAEQQVRIQQSHNYSKAADDMNLKGFSDAESKFLEVAGGNEAIGFVNDIFGDDTKRSVAVVNYLGREQNIDELKRIMAMPSTRQIAEISRLGYDKLELRKKTKQSTTEADEGLQGGGSSPTGNWQKELTDALKNKSTNEFQKLKKAAEAKLGRSIAYSEI